MLIVMFIKKIQVLIGLLNLPFGDNPRQIDVHKTKLDVADNEKQICCCVMAVWLLILSKILFRKRLISRHSNSSFHLLLFDIVLNYQHCLLSVIKQIKQFVLFDFQASNPGQFDNDIDNVWQKGHTSESVFHTVGLLVSFIAAKPHFGDDPPKNCEIVDKISLSDSPNLYCYGRSD